MTQFRVRNQKNLVVFLSYHRCKYQVIYDGWEVEIECNNINEFFNIGKMFGDYLSSSPQLNLITIEELEQRGDI